MSANTVNTLSAQPRVIQVRLRTLALLAALPAVTAFGLIAMAASSSGSSNSNFAQWEFKCIKPGAYAEIDGVERELNGWGKEGWEVPDSVVIGRQRGEKAAYQLQAGNGDFIMLKRQR